MSTLEILKEVGFSGVVDIVFMTFLLYTILLWLKKTRAAAVVAGIIIIGVVYLLAKQFDLYMTASVFHQFFAVILIVLVVIFQEELRHFFERVAVWSLRDRTVSKKDLARLSRREVEVLVRALTELAKDRTGAIVVLKGQDPISRHLDAAIELNGQLSEQLLLSIFDTHSAGHDGAVVIDRSKVAFFGCQLPLSNNFQILQRRGTRHAAALGLSEKTDVLCIVVSEERGTITLVRNGEMQIVGSADKLTVLLEKFYRDTNPDTNESRPFWDYFGKNSKEKIFAFLMTIVLWFVLVHESRLVYKTITVPVEYTELSEGFVLQKVEPNQVNVTFSAPRRTFYFFDNKQIMVLLKIPTIKEGKRSLSISNTDILYPRNLSLINTQPKKVDILIESKETIRKRKEKEEQLERERKEKEKKEKERLEKEKKERERKEKERLEKEKAMSN